MAVSRSSYFEKTRKVSKHKGRVPREKQTLRDKRPKPIKEEKDE